LDAPPVFVSPCGDVQKNACIFSYVIGTVVEIMNELMHASDSVGRRPVRGVG
jgi:hypothetical protein